MAEPALQLPEEDNREYINGAKPEQDNRIYVHGATPEQQKDNREYLPGVAPDDNGEEADGNLEQPQQGAIDRAQDLKDRVDQTREGIEKARGYRDRFNDWRQGLRDKKAAKAGAKEAGKKGLREGVEKQGAAAAKRKVATQGAQQVAKAGAKTAATTAAKAGATAATLGAEAAAGPAGWVAGAITILSIIGKPLLNFVKNNWKIPVYVIAGLLLLLAVPFGLLGGKGVDIKPTTAAEKNQAVVAAALAGNLVAGRQVTQKNADEIKTHYKDLVKLAKPEKKAEVEKRTNEIAVLLDQLVSLSGDPQKKLLAQIKEKEKSLMDKYSELFAETGTCADLAPFIASGQFRVGSGPNAKNIILGKMAIKASGKTEPASQGLCKMLVLALKSGYKIHTDTLSYGHPILTNKGNRSDHTCGAAIDINYVNADASGTFDRKHHADNGNPDIGKLAKLWYDAGLAGTIYVKQMIVPSAFKQFGMKDNQQKTNYSRALQDDHENHIHLAGRLEPGACQ